MKKLFVLAALLMATTVRLMPAIRFPSRSRDTRSASKRRSNCNSLSCIQISAPSLSGSSFGGFGSKSKRSSDDSDVAERTAPAVPRRARPAQATPPQPAAPLSGSRRRPSAPRRRPDDGCDASPSAAQPVTEASSAPAVAPARPPHRRCPRCRRAGAAPTTPLGIWATEENKGNVRIESCGQNLCGYAVKTGEKILINMKPQDSKWTGQIHDPDSGRNYDSTIAMKGTNTLRVQGCAFGGMFCGGQTWKRVS